MLKEIDLRSLPRTIQKSEFELIRLDADKQTYINVNYMIESNSDLNVLVCMLLNNPNGPINFLFDEPIVDLHSIYEEPRYSVLCQLCLEVFAMRSDGFFIGMQIQNVRQDKISDVMNSLDKDIMSLFPPTTKKGFVPPNAGSVRAFLVDHSLSGSSTTYSGGPFLIRQCQLRGGVLGIPLLGKSIDEIESNVALTSLSKLFCKVIILGGITNGAQWESTHLILEINK